MRKIFKITLCFLFVLGCTEDNNLLNDIAKKGGMVVFEEIPSSSFNILKFDTETISATIKDYDNNNVTSYSLSAIYNGSAVDVNNGKVANDIMKITSFPATIDITIGEIIAALELTNDDLSLASRITLFGTIVTPTGTYSGLSPDLDSDTNANQGGDTTSRLKSKYPNQAMEFKFSFFLPPGKLIRGTSFEEVLIGSTTDTYDRNGGNDVTGDLIIDVNPPFVDFTASGSTANNEIGFNTEYFAVPNISSSSLGFSKERIGVYSLFEDYTEYPDGTKGYHIEDADGGIRITFETVNVPTGQTKSGVSFDVYFNDSSWESKDGLIAYVNITTASGSSTIEMANVFDDDVEAIAGKWITYNTGYQTGVLSYQLVLEARSGATPESFDFDNIIVYEPEI